MTHAETTTQPGWRPDPSGRYEWRYWDGQWTSRVANSAPTAASAPPPAPAMPPIPPSPLPSPVSSGPAIYEPAPVPIRAPWEAAAAAPAAPTPPTPPSPAPSVAMAPPAVPAGTSSEAWWEAASAPTIPEVPDFIAPREPFGATLTTTAPPATGNADTIGAQKPKRSGSRVGAFFRSFATQPDSYQTAQEIWPDEEDLRGESIVVASPGNYGRVGLVVLAAAGMLAGAYLPWISGTLGTIAFQESGFDLGHGPAYGLGTCALAVAALLTVRISVMRWVTMAIALVLAGFVARDLIHTYDLMKSMNVSAATSADVGTGLWILVSGAAIGMVAAFRLSEDEKIV